MLGPLVLFRSCAFSRYEAQYGGRPPAAQAVSRGRDLRLVNTRRWWTWCVRRLRRGGAAGAPGSSMTRSSIGPATFSSPSPKKAGIGGRAWTVAVLRRTVREMRGSFCSSIPGLSINLNLSPDDLKNDRIGNELKICLGRRPTFPPSTIKLEITEARTDQY